MLHRLLRYWGFTDSSMGAEAERCLDTTLAAARAAHPALWAASSRHIPTRQAKFEEFCLHLAAHLPPPTNRAARRALLEAAIYRLEIGLREAGVGDLAVGKEMRQLAAALHGRLKSYEEALVNNDFNSFTSRAALHGIPPALSQSAWPGTPPQATPATRKKPLPTPPKAAKRATATRRVRAL